MAALLDVNALIALVDADHVGHRAIRTWFSANQRSGWATCPLTENGMVRVLSQPAYASGQRTPAEVIEILAALKTAFKISHEFWAEDASLTDSSLFESTLIAGSRQVTDVYLIGLAARHEATLVTFDRKISWHAVRGASEQRLRVIK